MEEPWKENGETMDTVGLGTTMQGSCHNKRTNGGRTRGSYYCMDVQYRRYRDTVRYLDER